MVMGTRRTTAIRWRGWARLAGLAAALALVLAACTQPGDGTNPPPPPPPPPPVSGNVVTAVMASAPAAAARVQLSYDPAVLTFLGLSDGADTVLVRAQDDPSAGTLVLSWVGAADQSGDLVHLHWEADPLGSQPTVGAAVAYARDGSDGTADLTLLQPASSGAVEDASYLVGASFGSQVGSQVLVEGEVPDLRAAYADHELGDLYPPDTTSASVSGDGVLDLRDVLALMELADSGSATGYQGFHGDLVEDDLIDAADVEQLLAKIADPATEAALVVKPRRLSYAALASGVPVLVGNAGSAALPALSLGGATGGLSQTNPLGAERGAVLSYADANAAFGTLTVAAGGAQERVVVGNVVVLVAGQSNASGRGDPYPPANAPPIAAVRMLGNDYAWKLASEPLDDGTGQVDTVSAEVAGDPPANSLGVALGTLLHDGGTGLPVGGRYVYLIPTAKGGTSLAGNANDPNGWLPGGTSLADRTYLFGSAVFRGRTSAGLEAGAPASAVPAQGGPVNVVYWYQGESDRDASRRPSFAGNTANVFDGFTTSVAGGGLGSPLVIFAQLASRGLDGTETDSLSRQKYLEQSDVAERQRRMADGARVPSFASNGDALDPVPSTPIAARADTYMVVTHDLARSDHDHLSAAAQATLAERVARVIDRRLLGDTGVDDTGPRLVGIDMVPGTPFRVRVRTDRAVTDSSGDYAGYFQVWDGAPSPGSVDQDLQSYGTSNDVAVTDARRDPADDTAVLLTLAAPVSGTAYVKYARPFLAQESLPFEPDVVRDAASGLPLPAFGPLPANGSYPAP